MTEYSPLRQLRQGMLPKMVSWYDPRLLARIGVRTIISNVFGQYADQRLIQAVTDPATDAELVSRYDYCTDTTDPDKCLPVDDDGAVWIDYMADTGDGFESTYTMAYLLAQESLDVKNAGRLRAGSVLIMGGDQCYPQATREEYKRRLQTPFDWAFQTPEPKRKLFAIPGNHDWYDGLIAFDSLFCASRDKLSNNKGNTIGGWVCQQHRSYWALRLPHKWWIWGADIQFSKYLDAAQVNYFERIAQQMGPEDNLIICLAEPSWLLADLQEQDPEENFFKITAIARKRGARVVAVLAGDWHHYNRYFAHELDVHFITSGGGGAFLHPTHVLRNAISVRWPEKQEWPAGKGPDGDETHTRGPHRAEAWKARDVGIELKRNSKPAETAIGQAVQDVEDAIDPLKPATLKQTRRKAPLKAQAPKCYPSKGRSYLMGLGNILFPFYNPAFAVGIGLLYWLITWQFQNIVGQYGISGGKIDEIGLSTSLGELLPYMPLYIIQAMIASISLVLMLGGLYAVLVSYVDAVDRPGLRRTLTKFFVGTGHFLAHATAMFTLSLVVIMINNTITPPIERTLTSVYEQREDRAPIVRDVIQEGLQPLHRKKAEAQPAAPQPQAAGQTKRTPTRELVGFVAYPVLMIISGAFIGGGLWGLYWVVTGMLFRMHSEQAFAALRLKNYKNFLRIKVERDALTIFPLGVDKIPGPDDWMEQARGKPNPLSNQPKLIAVNKIDVRLIENPIVIPRVAEAD
jgi:hypothetical protein